MRNCGRRSKLEESHLIGIVREAMDVLRVLISVSPVRSVAELTRVFIRYDDVLLWGMVK